jgi:hypothetical protein
MWVWASYIYRICMFITHFKTIFWSGHSLFVLAFLSPLFIFVYLHIISLLTCDVPVSSVRKAYYRIRVGLRFTITEYRLYPSTLLRAKAELERIWIWNNWKNEGWESAYWIGPMSTKTKRTTFAEFKVGRWKDKQITVPVSIKYLHNFPSHYMYFFPYSFHSDNRQ